MQFNEYYKAGILHMASEKSKGTTYCKARRDKRLEHSYLAQVWIPRADMDLVREAVKLDGATVCGFIRDAAVHKARERLGLAS